MQHSLPSPTLHVSVIVVHPNPALAESLATALRAAGHRADSFVDSLAALAEIERRPDLNLLISAVNFPPRRPTGISIARMARLREPALRVLFIGEPGEAEFTRGIGEVLPRSIQAATLLRIVANLFGTPASRQYAPALAR